MRLGVVGLGLIGGSMALGLRERHDVSAFDVSEAARGAATRRGLRVVDGIDALFPADAVVVATPLASIVPTLESLAALAGDAVLIEVGSLKSAVVTYAERAPRGTRVIGLHPMAGSTATGFDAADPAIFRGRPFIVVPTARSEDPAREVASGIARELGGTVTVCPAAEHDRAVALVSAVPLAAALALRQLASRGSIDIEAFAGPGFRDATRLAGTPPDLALALLGAPGLREHLASLREAIDEIAIAIGSDAALRAILERARGEGRS